MSKNTVITVDAARAAGQALKQVATCANCSGFNRGWRPDIRRLAS